MFNFFWIAREALSVLLVFWPVTGVIVTVLLIGVPLRGPSDQIDWARFRRWLTLLGIFPILIIAGGTVWEGAERFPNPIYWRSYTIAGLLVAQALVAIMAVVKCRGIRVLTAGAASLFLWYSWWCFFIAGMSIVDDWI